MAKKKWMPIGDNAWIRPTEDGQYEARMVERTGSGLAENRRIRREVKRNPRSAWTKSGMLQRKARLPVTVEMELQEKYGNDPEKRKMYLRDHPQYLLVPEHEAHLPPSRAYFSFPRNPLAKETPKHGS